MYGKETGYRRYKTGYTNVPFDAENNFSGAAVHRPPYFSKDFLFLRTCFI
jgi:hypothetical protein